MMKFRFVHPSGLEISFEVDASDFERFKEYLPAEVIRGVFERMSPGEAVDTDQLGAGGNEGGEDDASDDEAAKAGEIDVRKLAEDLERIGASSDIERVTVIAHAAGQAGMEGIDYSTMNRLYDELGYPKPPRWPKPFSNAKARGLVRNVKYGIWLPTIQGENFARYGRRDTAKKRSGRKPAGGATDLAPELPKGDSSS
jgi:hypothetical protein